MKQSRAGSSTARPAAPSPPARAPLDKRAGAKSLTDLMAKFTGYIGKRLPQDVLDKLTELRSRQEKPPSRIVCNSMFEYLDAADRLDRPCCQDTGALQFFVRAGAGFPLLGELKDILGEAVRIPMCEAPLRRNAVATFVGKDTGTKTGPGIPWVDWETVPDDDTCTIEVYMAGGGCSLPGAAKVLTPAAGYEGVVQFVFDVITSRGVNACPPLLVGVGICASVETASLLSKRAILRPIGTHNPDPRAAKVEALLEKRLNDVGIGPPGMSGSSSVMGVHIESATGPPSAIGVGVSVGCWAHRRGTIRINADLSYEILSHKGAVL